MKTKLTILSLAVASIASAQTTNLVPWFTNNLVVTNTITKTITTTEVVATQSVWSYIPPFYDTNYTVAPTNIYTGTNPPPMQGVGTNAIGSPAGNTTSTDFQQVAVNVPGNGVYAPVYQFNGVYFTNMAMLTTNGFGQGNIDLSVPVGSSNWTYYTVTNQ